MPQLVWLVTGCSTGFGAEFIKAILQRGDKAIATARRVDSLKELADLGAATLQLDVTASVSELHAKVQEAVKIYGHIDVLVSNAGYVQIGAVEEMGDALLKQLQTNTFGSVNLITAIMPHWRERKSGYLVVNSSYTAWWSLIPLAGAYMASKAALDRLVSCFAAEVASLGYIKTLTIHPGHFRTEVVSAEKHVEALAKKSENYQPIVDYMTGFRESWHGNQPGDTRKAVELTLDVVRGEGKAAGKQVPSHMWMGSDTYREVKAHCEQTLDLLEEWKDAIESTDV